MIIKFVKYKSIIGKAVELTSERIRHISQGHPDIIGHLPKIKQVLLMPDEIRLDNQDSEVLLFYKFFSKIGDGKYLVIVVKANARNFVLTFFSTYRIKSGEKYEIEK